MDLRNNCVACLQPRQACVCKKPNALTVSQEEFPDPRVKFMIEKLQSDIQNNVKLINDKARLIALSKDLLKGADLLAREENLVQPFLAIILRHVDTISEFKLTGED